MSLTTMMKSIVIPSTSITAYATIHLPNIHQIANRSIKISACILTVSNWANADLYICIHNEVKFLLRRSQLSCWELRKGSFLHESESCTRVVQYFQSLPSIKHPILETVTENLAQV